MNQYITFFRNSQFVILNTTPISQRKEDFYERKSKNRLLFTALLQRSRHALLYVFRNGTADISPDWLKTIREVANGYVGKIFDILRRYDYEPALMKLYIVGGGGALVRHFGSYDRNRVIINDDICATAKGYEKWAEHQLAKADGNEC